MARSPFKEGRNERTTEDGKRRRRRRYGVKKNSFERKRSENDVERAERRRPQLALL